MPPGFSRPLSDLAGPKEVVRQFTPNWFAASMGTGVLALALEQLAARWPLLDAPATGLWAANIGVFVLCCGLYGARWVLYGAEARRVFDHPVMSMYLGCIPMALATIVNGCLAFGPRFFGAAAATAAACDLWRLDALLALAVGIVVPFAMFTRQRHAVEDMTAVWLLPLVAAEVAAASAGLLAPHLASPKAALGVLAAGYALWACSVPMALGVLTILTLRLALHKLPPAAMAPSCWLALGPLGTGALGLLVLGHAAAPILAADGLPALAASIEGPSLLGGLVLWGYGAWWAVMAVLMTCRYLKTGFAFSLAWWGYTFPLGVFTLATLKLADILRLETLSWSGVALVAILSLAWAVVAAKTLAGLWRGSLFHAPCIADPAT